MVSVDNLIEPSGLVLRNMWANSEDKDLWVSGTGYQFYLIKYTTPLIPSHYYYTRFTYKYTTTSSTVNWARIYILGGSGASAGVNNPSPNSEYTSSALTTILNSKVVSMADPLTGGNIYHSPNSGVTGYAKNIIIYDVTDLYSVLKAYGIVTNDSTMKTWCDDNLEYTSASTPLNVANKITILNKTFVDNGTLIANDFIETDGVDYLEASFNKLATNWCDGSAPVGIYNGGNGTVTFSYVNAKEQGSPFADKHSKCLKITTNGEAIPGTGGFFTFHMSAANKWFLETFVAKIPVGYKILAHHNEQGTGYLILYPKSRIGTGKWEQYTILYKCGSSGTFSTGGHVALHSTDTSKYPETSVTWYVAYIQDIDITDNKDLLALAVLPNSLNIKNGKCLALEFNESNLIPNSSLLTIDSSMLRSGWTFDTDVPATSGAFHSIVLPVGGESDIDRYNWACPMLKKIPIDSSARYKISFWVKCKGDMSTYLMAVQYWVGDKLLEHANTLYCSGTKTTLARALNPGDTVVYLKSAANWAPRSYSRLAFRNNFYRSSYHDLGTFTGGYSSEGLISSVDTTNNTITLKTAYTGTAHPVGRCICEGSNGGNFYYPFGKNDLPTDNTWKYMEHLFGSNAYLGDGTIGNVWSLGIPADVTHVSLSLNIYNNDGTVPIKFANIRLEEVGTQSGHKMDNKIQIQRL